jgi:hypothetical protein
MTIDSNYLAIWKYCDYNFFIASHRQTHSHFEVESTIEILFTLLVCELHLNKEGKHCQK